MTDAPELARDDIDRLLAAVAFVRDAEKVSETLAGIKAAQDAADARVAAADAAEAKAATRLHEAKRNLAEAQAETNAAAAMLRDAGVITDKNTARTAELLERARQLQVRETDVASRSVALDRTKVEFDAWEAKLADREEAAAAKLANAETLLAQYDADRHDAVRKLAG